MIEFAFEKTIYKARALEVEASLWVAEFLEQPRGIDSIEGFGHREAAFFDESGYEILYNLFLHVLKICLGYFHKTFMSLSIAS